MDVADDTNRQLLDRLQQHGKAARITPDPQPGDDELIRLARWIAEHLGAADLLPAVVDQDLLVELRDAYNQGRRADRLDFDAVARELGRLGVASVIRHTGDGCATLHGGKTRRSWRTGVRGLPARRGGRLMLGRLTSGRSGSGSSARPRVLAVLPAEGAP